MISMTFIPTTAVRPSSFGMFMGHYASVAPKAVCAAVVWPVVAGSAHVSTLDAASLATPTKGGVALAGGRERKDINGTTFATRQGHGTLAWSPPTV